jgi:hypothetical protein
MTKFHKKGATVSWKWGQGEPSGQVEEVFFEPVEKTIKGTLVKRNASQDNPAYLIKEDNGNIVLKLHSELSQ